MYINKKWKSMAKVISGSKNSNWVLLIVAAMVVAMVAATLS
jgi:hypothetical protein